MIELNGKKAILNYTGILVMEKMIRDLEIKKCTKVCPDWNHYFYYTDKENKRIKVFFMKDSVRTKDPMSWIKIPKEYKLENYGTVVAHVDTDSLDGCFMLTNHITHNWTLNPKVIMDTEKIVRSSSVGDLFEIIGGRSYIVDSTGFKKV